MALNGDIICWCAINTLLSHMHCLWFLCYAVLTCVCVCQVYCPQ